MKNIQKHYSRLGHCGQWMIGVLLTGGAVYLLLPEFRPQILTALPWLIILLCPFMHIFMHRGHGKRQHGDHDNG
jgi:hypothetical protein